MTSAPVDLSRTRERHEQPRPTGVDEPLSPARRVLPWALLLLVLSVVATGYALVLQVDTVLTALLVVAVAVLGAIAGLSVRDGRDRWVPTRRVLADAVRALGRALWH